MAAFDPDAYLKGQGFDPDAFLKAAQAPAPISVSQKALNMVGRGAWALPGLVGLTAEKAQALTGKLGDLVSGRDGPSLTEREAAQKKLSRQVDTENPITSGIVRGLAAAPGEALLAMAAPQVKLAQGASALKKALAIGPRLGTLAAASEYGSTGHKDLGERVAGAAAAGAGGTLLGGAMGAALPNPAALLPGARQAVDVDVRGGGPLIQPRPTPAAQELLSEGVPLTAGQRNPAGIVGKLEAASTKNLLGGMEKEREAAVNAWRLGRLGKAVKEGDPAPLPKNINEAMADVYQRFGPEYDAIRGEIVPAKSLQGLPERSLDLPGGIDARAKAQIAEEIRNALTVIPEESFYKPGPGGRFGPAPRDATAGDLMKVLENLRKQSRTARASQNFDKLELLQHAQDVVSSTLEQSLGKKSSAALKDINRRYAIFNTLEDAVSRAGLEGEFRPKQISAPLRKSVGRRAFSQGGGPAEDLQRSAASAARVFDELPQTGIVGKILSSIPGAHYAAGPLAALANMQRPGLRGQMTVASPGLDPAVAALLAAVRRPRVGFVPAAAEEDPR